MNNTAKPKNMSWVIPYLIVKDAGASATYYHEQFGFEVLSLAKDDDGNVFHAELQYKDVVIMCGAAGFDGQTITTPAEGKFISPVTLYLYHENVDALHENLLANGVSVDAPPEDQFWGDRMLRLTDQDGHQWSFATHGTKQG